MGRTPTLQSLALKARDHFGEDGYPFEESIPTSLDVVVSRYAEGADSENVSGQVSAALRRHLESRGRSVAQTNVDEFSHMALAYLRTVYPDAARVRDEEEQRAISHLFWGHLVQARHAPGAPGLKLSGFARGATPVKHSVTCSCGATLASRDEEELYRFARAHAAQQHQAPPPPRHPVAGTTSSGTRTPETIVQQWEEQVVNQGDLAAIDDLSPAGPAEELKEQVTMLRAAFPDLRVTIEEMIASADEVALRSTLQGTHQGTFRGVAPTGKHVTVEAYEFFRIQDDQIVERRGGVEEVRLLQQLGVLPG